MAADYDNDSVAVTEISNDDLIIYSGTDINDLNLFQDANGVLDEINLEITGGARITDNLNVDADVEGLNVASTGGVANRVDEIDQVDTEVMITGDTDLIFGEIGSGNANDSYEFDGGLINASLFTGNLTTTLGEGNQSVIGGSGDDVIEVEEDGGFYSAGDADKIDLTVGGSDTVQFNGSNGDGIGEPLDTVVDYHEVFGFDVADDVLAVDASDFGPTGLRQTDGDAVAEGETALFLEVQSGEDFFTTDEAGNNFNVLKFTTPAFGADVDTLYEFAIGSGQVDVAGAGREFLGTVFDVTNQQMVLFTVNDGGGIVEPTDDVDVIAVVGMTQSDYDAFSASNISFI